MKALLQKLGRKASSGQPKPLHCLLNTGVIPRIEKLFADESSLAEAVRLLYPDNEAKLVPRSIRRGSTFYGRELFSVLVEVGGETKTIYIKDAWEGAQLEGLGYELCHLLRGLEAPYAIGLQESGTREDYHNYSEGTIMVEGWPARDLPSWVPSGNIDKARYTTALGRWLVAATAMQLGDRQLASFTSPIDFSSSPRNVAYDVIAGRILDFDFGFLFSGARTATNRAPRGLKAYQAEFERGLEEGKKILCDNIAKNRSRLADLADSFAACASAGSMYLRPSNTRCYNPQGLHEILKYYS